MSQYEVYTLNWAKFQTLVERPTKLQIYELAELLAEGLEELEGEFDEDDEILDWPIEARELMPTVAQRLKLTDWYGDLSTMGKSLWESLILNVVELDVEWDLDTRLEVEALDSTLIESAFQALKQTSADPRVLAEFGSRPFRCPPSAIDSLAWAPVHSMHTPQETQRIRQAFELIAPTLRAMKDASLIQQWEKELMPVLDRCQREGRLLLARSESSPET